MPNRRKGFTLIELLIVIAIIMLLMVLAYISFRGQINKANDAKRKSDLFTMRNAIEEYNNDHFSFPSVLNCGGTDLVPYLAKVPCDPNGSAYGYFVSASTGGYRVCTVLSDTTDPAIGKAGCGGAAGCGLGGGYNYCLAQGTTASAVGTADEVGGSGVVPTTGPTAPPGTPGQYTGNYACTPAGDCNSYSNPQCKGCPQSYASSNCDNACSNPVNRCTDILVPNCP